MKYLNIYNSYEGIGEQNSVNIVNGNLSFVNKQLDPSKVDIYPETKTVTCSLTVQPGKYGTFVAPFDVEIPENLNVYDKVEMDGSTCNFIEAKLNGRILSKNTPVVLENNTDAVITATYTKDIDYNINTVSKAYSNTNHYLVGFQIAGVDLAQYARDNNATLFVMQTQNGHQSFYKVNSTSSFKSSANRCALYIKN